MKKPLTLLIAIISVVLGHSQRNLTIEEATSGQYQKFAAETYAFVQWRGKTNEFTYLVDYEKLMKASDKSAWQGTELSNLSNFKTALKSFASGTDIDVDKVYYFPYTYEWISDSVMLVDAAGSKYNYSLSFNPYSNKIDQIMFYDLDAEQVFMSPTRKGMAYTIENNLYYRSEKGTSVFAITSDENKGIVNGSDYVHRQEFGIDKGIFHSPNGNFVAFYRKDETMVAEYPLVNTASRI